MFELQKVCSPCLGLGNACGRVGKYPVEALCHVGLVLLSEYVGDIGPAVGVASWLEGFAHTVDNGGSFRLVEDADRSGGR